MFNINKVTVNAYKPAERPVSKFNASFLLKLIISLLQIIGIIIFEVLRGILNVFMKNPRAKISGQLALVTGGANGLGRALCFRLAQEGCDIAIADIDLLNANRTANEIKRSYQVTCRAYKCDISESSSLTALKDAVERDLREIDILVNNAGLLYMADFVNSNLDDIQRVMQVNLTSQILITRLFLPRMIERGNGRIMSICSVAGVTTLPVALVYVSSKWGLNGFMKCLSDELIANDCEKTVKLTTVLPDFIETRKELSETLDKVNHFLPRLTPEEVADTAVNGMLKNRSKIYVSHFTPLYYIYRFLPDAAKKFLMKNVWSLNAIYNKKEI